MTKIVKCDMCNIMYEIFSGERLDIAGYIGGDIHFKHAELDVCHECIYRHIILNISGDMKEKIDFTNKENCKT